jgi:hypothetical protein
MRTYDLDRLQHEITAGEIQVVWRLIHAFFLEGGTGKMLLHNRGAWRIVPAVDGSRRVAVQAAAVACKCDQIGHGKVDFNARRDAP